MVQNCLGAASVSMKPTEPATEERTNESKRPHQRPWRLRWSMRGLFIAITLLCLIFGLVGQRLYVGLVHADVGEQLTLQAEKTPIRYGSPSPDKVIIGWTIPHQPVGRIDFANDNELPTWMKWTNSDVLFRRLDHVLVVPDIPDHDLEFTFQEIHRLGELRELTVQRFLSAEDLDRLISPLKVQKLFIRPLHGENKPLPFLRNLGVKDLEIHGFPEIAIEDLPLSLEHLDIGGADIADRSLSRFVRLKNLKRLDLSHTLATREGIEDLRQEMPWCEIDWEKRGWWNGKRIEENPSP